MPLALPVPVGLDPKGSDGAQIAARRLKESADAERITQAVKAEIAGRALREGMVSLRTSGEGLVVSLREAGFFDSGAAAVRPASLEALRSIVASLPRRVLRGC